MFHRPHSAAGARGRHSADRPQGGRPRGAANARERRRCVLRVASAARDLAGVYPHPLRAWCACDRYGWWLRCLTCCRRGVRGLSLRSVKQAVVEKTPGGKRPCTRGGRPTGGGGGPPCGRSAECRPRAPAGGWCGSVGVGRVAGALWVVSDVAECGLGFADGAGGRVCGRLPAEVACRYRFAA